MLKPIPTIEEAFNMVAQDERQRSIKHVIKTDNVAFQARGVPTCASSAHMDPTEYAAAYNTYCPRGNLLIVVSLATLSTNASNSMEILLDLSYLCLHLLVIKVNLFSLNNHLHLAVNITILHDQVLTIRMCRRRLQMW
ncbi:hypothetical protein Bca4012_093010 [Brassica carinata]